MVGTGLGGGLESRGRNCKAMRGQNLRTCGLINNLFIFVLSLDKLITAVKQTNRGFMCPQQGSGQDAVTTEDWANLFAVHST